MPRSYAGIFAGAVVLMAIVLIGTLITDWGAAASVLLGLVCGGLIGWFGDMMANSPRPGESREDFDARMK